MNTILRDKGINPKLNSRKKFGWMKFEKMNNPYNFSFAIDEGFRLRFWPKKNYNEGLKQTKSILNWILTGLTEASKTIFLIDTDSVNAWRRLAFVQIVLAKRSRVALQTFTSERKRRVGNSVKWYEFNLLQKKHDKVMAFIPKVCCVCDTSSTIETLRWAAGIRFSFTVFTRVTWVDN